MKEAAHMFAKFEYVLVLPRLVQVAVQKKDMS